MTQSNDQPATLRDDQLELLRRAGRPQDYLPRDHIFAEGDRSEYAVLIDQGKVKLTAEAENGRTIVLALRSAGDLIGELGCIDGAPRSASVIALTPVTATLIASSKFRQILNKRNDIALSLFAITIARLRESDRRQLEFGAYNGIDRTIRIILNLAEQQGEPVAGSRTAVRLEAYQRDLAEAAGVSRETVGRAEAQLARAGVLTRDKGVIVIHDLDLLRDIASRGQR